MTKPSICEEETYSSIYQQNAERLRNFLYYKCGNMQKAEDIMQDAFVKLWRKCAEVLFGKVEGFLFTVGNNLFIDSVRAKNVSLKFEKTIVQESDKNDPLFQLRTEEFKKKMEKTIADLSEAQREAFLMNRIDKMTFSEIAKVLDISQTAVEKRVSKALLNLKSKIEELKEIKI